MPPPNVVTLGCRLNTLESEIMRSEAERAGLEDTIIVNTCAVTAEAERQARQTIRRLGRDNPGRRIIVTGCAAQLKPEEFASMEEVSRVLGNSEKMDGTRLSADEGPDVAVSDIMNAPEAFNVPMISGFEDRTRAFVQVQQGCDHRCSFCIIPFVRGPNRSVQPKRVIDQVRTLTENGHGEVVLTGVDVSSYGQDAETFPTLGDLARQILDQVPALQRLRITSLDPACIDDDIFCLLGQEERFMPHLHLSLQAADDMVLKRMKRRHNRQDAIDLIEGVRNVRPDTVFGADLIAGFPTETDTQFENTLNTIADMGLTYLHVFPYSARPDTPAAKMPAVNGAIVRERAQRLRQVGEAALNRFLSSNMGESVQVLVEQDRKGHTRHFAPVKLTSDAPVGAIVDARVNAIDEKKGRLIAELAA
ncbi:MAG TPA: tRNA (N(6)-L-threonylcarbamoyladenosine(37)-C(2))-methylthiotransferase MtaB [Rhodospirillales bacterium]|nr:tRNA (N(6)-L-threonylcarbamoyladenosine(37)-C(2))-methylthiotransferase MtaB [Rhodospirillales bacterium]